MEVLERRPAWEGEAPQPEVQDDIVSAIARLDDGELQIVHSDLLLVKLGATCWHPIKALRGLAQASDLVLVSQLEQPSSADAAAALLTVLRSAIFSPMQVDEAGDEETAHMALASFHRSADCRLLRPLRFERACEVLAALGPQCDDAGKCSLLCLAEAAADDSENCGLRYLGCTVRRAGALEILKIRRVAADSFSSLADVQANFRSALTPLGCAANDLDVRVRARAIYALGEHARYISQTPSCPISRLNDTLLSIAPAGGATDADATTTEAFDLATPPSAAVAVAWSGVQHVARPLCPPPSLCAATLLLRDSTVPSEEAAGFASPRDSLRRLLCTVRREREARSANDKAEHVLSQEDSLARLSHRLSELIDRPSTAVSVVSAPETPAEAAETDTWETARSLDFCEQLWPLLASAAVEDDAETGEQSGLAAAARVSALLAQLDHTLNGDSAALFLPTIDARNPTTLAARLRAGVATARARRYNAGGTGSGDAAKIPPATAPLAMAVEVGVWRLQSDLQHWLSTNIGALSAEESAFWLPKVIGPFDSAPASTVLDTACARLEGLVHALEVALRARACGAPWAAVQPLARRVLRRFRQVLQRPQAGAAPNIFSANLEDGLCATTRALMLDHPLVWEMSLSASGDESDADDLTYTLCMTTERIEPWSRGAPPPALSAVTLERARRSLADCEPRHRSEALRAICGRESAASAAAFLSATAAAPRGSAHLVAYELTRCVSSI